MADADFTRLPRAWSNIPADGYDIAGGPAVLRFITGITGEDGTWPEVVITIGADGSITMPDGYEPVIRDGKLTGWRELEPALVADAVTMPRFTIPRVAHCNGVAYVADDAYLHADAEDARTALHEAAAIAATRGDVGLLTGEKTWLALAEGAYRFLRNRDSLRPIRVSIVPGTPYLEGTNAMTATFDLSDVDEVVFSLTGLDAKGAAVPLVAGFTAAWSLADPDASGAVLTVSADTTTATVAAGVPDTNLMLSVTVTNADGSTLSGAEAIVVQASAATTVDLVAGTPTPEPPAGG